MNEYITPDEAAAELGVTANWIRQLCMNGRIPGAKKFNRSWMVPRGAKISPVAPGRPLRTLEIPKSKGGKR